jgi:vancomycin permeability regulator SanA
MLSRSQIVAVGAGIFLSYAAALILAGLAPREAHADIAVLLGSEVQRDGRPSPRLRARLDQAADVYRRGLAPLILVSGGIDRNGADEAAVMSRYLAAAGIPSGKILIDSAGVNTAATAKNTALVLRDRHLRSVLIITQYFHVVRCLIAFHKVGIASIAASYPKYADWRDLYSIAREMAAAPIYWIRS